MKKTVRFFQFHFCKTAKTKKQRKCCRTPLYTCYMNKQQHLSRLLFHFIHYINRCIILAANKRLIQFTFSFGNIIDNSINKSIYGTNLSLSGY